ncbi:Hybrid signal transduction histidine kinase K [Fulvia fulva]|uniref:Hybrid signal transduction histidine kinase K n=1 Tax=Passalora fulva TaxID=5499 RepID=A0A9Q8USY9_PASFU|nr:Hybrid signal transduction histidine kinase K [Fulvia fulva]KAK4619152.1 Hybrid signal transduction histidine kinase K [Fulvia fulva]UJO21296.1 Hybrid signal transduction histidine kinase K [Fulvia fulva]WPV18308.1 Hybrid signal transduction histidine kinase K [Fulvia fulva]WPV33285.1 Hybrid signal transduction histidine kinase K [Fulvia fulva]
MDDETTTDLPEQLRALLDFLDADHRPSIVLEPRRDAHEAFCKVVGKSQAFQKQARPDDELEDVRQAVQRTLAWKLHVSALHGIELAGKRWQTRIAGGHCIIAVNGLSTMLGEQNGKNARKYLDWTQNAIPNMSPWVQFVRDVDWAATSVGPMHSWPLLLRQPASLLDAWTELKEKKNPIAIEYRLKKPWTSLDRSTGQELSGETWLMATAFPEIEADALSQHPSRLLQVVINLLTNSIKFTQHSEVRNIEICLGASYQRPTGRHHGISFVPPRLSRSSRSPFIELEGADDIYLQVAVYHTGRGLTDDEMKLLFQRFQQASPKTYKQYGGSGLGLFISRELCELQGGQIGVSSGEGKTCFTFFVKAKRWTPESELQPAKANLNNKFTSNAASPMAFGRRGSTVLETATNQLGHGSGDEDPECEKYEPMSATQSTTSKSTTKPAKESTNPVKDNLINQKVMSQQLKRAGCIVHVANHGVECLDFLEKSTFCAAETPLSIILLDLEMPMMDGLTAIRHIRKRQRTGQINGHIPVIAVTANARSEQISQAVDAGMDQVVTKPFRIPELVPQMEALVKELSQVNGG